MEPPSETWQMICSRFVDKWYTKGGGCTRGLVSSHVPETRKKHLDSG